MAITKKKIDKRKVTRTSSGKSGGKVKKTVPPGKKNGVSVKKVTKRKVIPKQKKQPYKQPAPKITPESTSKLATSLASNPKPSQTQKIIRRRRIAHTLPEIGTILIGRLHGITFRCEIIADPDNTYDHGKALRSMDDSNLPLTYTINKAAQIFTESLRKKHQMKPIANGWKWWRRESDNKRLFDIEDYSWQATDILG